MPRPSNEIRVRRRCHSTLVLGFGLFIGCSDSGSEDTSSANANTNANSGANTGSESTGTDSSPTQGPSGSNGGLTTGSNSANSTGAAATSTQGTTAGNNSSGGGATTTSAGTGGSAPSSNGTTSGTSSVGGGDTSAGSSAVTAGTGGTGGELDPDALIVAPYGMPGAAGTLDDPTTLADALERAEAGITIYLRGGSYVLDSTQRLDAQGSEGAFIQLRAYPLDDERPLLDFSGMAEDSSNRGLSVSGNYWHVYGLDVFGAGDNCMFVSGFNNVVEYSTFSECADTGLQLGNGAANNSIVNCDSYYNADSSLENADGFAAKLDVGTGNRFVGCRAWNNLDDGWDGYLRPADGVTTTHENCWAIDNGKLQDGSVGAGDGNGFKTGGSDDKNLSHHASYVGCIATGNVNDGFDHNSNRGNVTILNSAAHDNGSNINFGTTNIAASLTIKNTISLGNNGSLSATSTDITNNSWQDGRAATADDFVSIDPSVLKGPRKSDGSLPDIDYLKLAPGSDLRNAGTDIGLPYTGSAPDIGPFESDE